MNQDSLGGLKITYSDYQDYLIIYTLNNSFLWKAGFLLSWKTCIQYMM